MINSGTQPLQNQTFVQSIESRSKGTLVASGLAKEANEKGLRALETLVLQHRERHMALGPYCLGTFSPAIVDAVMVPQMYNARRYGVDVDAICPLLVKIDDLCSRHAWFQVSHPTVQPDYPRD